MAGMASNLPHASHRDTNVTTRIPVSMPHSVLVVRCPLPRGGLTCLGDGVLSRGGRGYEGQ